MRGEARVARPGVVAVGEREIEYGNLVVATGSSPAVPPVEGLDDVDYWTNREAVWADAAPESIVVLGGGPVGVELAQFFHRLGSACDDRRAVGPPARAHRLRGGRAAPRALRGGGHRRTRGSPRRAGRGRRLGRPRLSLLRRVGRGRAAPRRDRAAAERGRSRPRAARRRAHEVGDHRRRADARRGRRLGDRRPERRRAAHACREVPGASRCGQHRGRRLRRRLPRDPGLGLHRSAGRDGRATRRATGSSRRRTRSRAGGSRRTSARSVPACSSSPGIPTGASSSARWQSARKRGSGSASSRWRCGPRSRSTFSWTRSSPTRRSRRPSSARFKSSTGSSTPRANAPDDDRACLVDALREDERRGRDLNPRDACTPNGFRDRPVRPLRHPSEPTA